MDVKEAMWWGTMVRQARKGNQSAAENLESENRLRAANGQPSVQEELKAMAEDPEVQNQVFDNNEKVVEKIEESPEVSTARREAFSAMLGVFYEMGEARHALADYGYTIIAKNKIKNFEEFKNNFDKELGDFIKETLRYNDTLFEEYLDDLFEHHKHREGDKILTLAEWAEINKKNFAKGQKEMVTLVYVLPSGQEMRLVQGNDELRYQRLEKWVLEAIEKQVAGRSFQEGIEEAKKDQTLRWQGVPENLEMQLERLTAALAGVELEEVLDEEAPMTYEELHALEQDLLNPEEPTVWDETPV